WGRGDGGIRGRPGRPDGSRRGRLGGDAVQTRRVVVTRDSGWVAAALIALLLAGPVRAEQTATPSSGDSESNTDLAKKTQNPVADLISVPFQNNFDFNTGPEKRSVWVLNVQPVVPIKLTEDWNLITRTIVPIINQPPLAPGVDQATGLGDINPSFFLSPSGSKEFILGPRPDLHVPDGQQQAARHGQVEHGTGGRRADDAGPLGGRRTDKQPVVVRRLGPHPGERAAPPAVRELQLRQGLVSRERAHPDGQLDGEQRGQVDRA